MVSKPGSNDDPVQVAEAGERAPTRPAQVRPSTTAPSPRKRAAAFIRGYGSLFDLWPVAKYEEVYPWKADDLLRRSMANVTAAYWTAFCEVTDEQEKGEPKAQASHTRPSRAGKPAGR